VSASTVDRLIGSLVCMKRAGIRLLIAGAGRPDEQPGHRQRHCGPRHQCQLPGYGTGACIASLMFPTRLCAEQTIALTSCLQQQSPGSRFPEVFSLCGALSRNHVPALNLRPQPCSACCCGSGATTTSRPLTRRCSRSSLASRRCATRSTVLRCPVVIVLPERRLLWLHSSMPSGRA